ncbi:UNVERIFIED_CONTAM: hypothetical protein Sradi_3198600 [Sesamum radiatum]|uniref:Uncharacterized protein n=1 Tax=Sesamum radiatum TaxID=300843 RepID=A0AAW2RHP1_SESRA
MTSSLNGMPHALSAGLAALYIVHLGALSAKAPSRLFSEVEPPPTVKEVVHVPCKGPTGL